MALSFLCPACRRTLRVDEQFAGRTVRCPGCGTALRIPGDSGISARPRPPQSAPPPGGEGPSEERPAPRPVRRPSRTWLYVLAGCGTASVLGLLLLVAAGGVVAWWYFSTSASGVAEAQKYLPDNCQFLVSLRMDRIEASKAYKDLKDAFPNLSQAEANGRYPVLRRAGADLTVMGGASLATPDFVTVTKTRKPITANDLLADNKGSAYKEVKVGRYTLYQGAQDAFCLPDGRTVVIGQPDTLRRALERGKAAPLSPGLQAAMNHTDFSKTAAWAVSFKESRPQQGGVPGLPQLGLPENNLFSADGLAGYADIGSDIRIVFTVLCKDAAAAEDTRKLIDGGVVAVKRAGRLSPEALEMIDGLKLSTSGNNLTGDLTLKTPALIKVMKQQNPGPFFPGR
jgi:hypothetical protein